MNWLGRVKDKIVEKLWKVRIILSTDVRELFKSPATIVPPKPFEIKEAFKEARKTLDAMAREMRALGPQELIQKREQSACVHTYSVRKQVWVRIADKKFELRNEIVCTKCKDSKIKSVG